MDEYFNFYCTIDGNDYTAFTRETEVIVSWINSQGKIDMVEYTLEQAKDAIRDKKWIITR